MVKTDEDAKPKRRGPSAPRLSITLTKAQRKKVKLAAALSDMEPTEWAKIILAQVSKRTVIKHYPNRA